MVCTEYPCIPSADLPFSLGKLLAYEFIFCWTCINSDHKKKKKREYWMTDREPRFLAVV